MIRLGQLEQKEKQMSYYNEMYVPVADESMEELADLLYFYEDEDGFENMIDLLNLQPKYLKIGSQGMPYLVLKSVVGAIDTLRPHDLDWGWHSRETYYGDCDCFIFVKDLHNRVDWTKVGSQDEYNRIEQLVSLYQSKLKKYGENLIIFPM